jgi:hypothetical protein
MRAVKMQVVTAIQKPSSLRTQRDNTPSRIYAIGVVSRLQLRFDSRDKG